MSIRKNLNYYEVWVISNMRGVPTNSFKHRSDMRSFRLRLSRAEIEVIESIRTHGRYSNNEISVLNYEGYVSYNSPASSYALPKNIKGAEELSVDFYYEADGTYKKIETPRSSYYSTNASAIGHASQYGRKGVAPLVIAGDKLNNTIKKDSFSQQEQNPALAKIIERYSPKELEVIANGKSDAPLPEVANIEFSGKWFKWMQMTDLHLGSKFTRPDDIIRAFRFAKSEGCDMITLAGDIFEGMSSRQGHIYELSHIGYNSQLEHGVEIFSYNELPAYAISGNHDEWFVKSNGAYIVKQLADSTPNMTYLGENYGTLSLNGARYELFHGLDGGGAYAISYRVQKIIEAFEGGNKPQILGTGHDHKAGYFFLRNVHAFLGGCMQTQSDWMRQTRKAAMKSYWIIEALIDKGEVKRLKMELIPFYK